VQRQPVGSLLLVVHRQQPGADFFLDSCVRNGSSFKRTFIFMNKEVTKHSNCRSNMDSIQKEHQIYMQMR
jgi:hypothetical protein